MKTLAKVFGGAVGIYLLLPVALIASLANDSKKRR